MNTNVSGNAYVLTTLCPVRNNCTEDGVAYANKVRDLLQEWNFEQNSPMAKVPGTYLCRFFVLDDVLTESLPTGSGLDVVRDLSPYVTDGMRQRAIPRNDRLKSRYLVFTATFHGGPAADLDGYLRGMWQAIGDRIREVWQYCYAFDRVKDADSFISYIRSCQLSAALFFNGSNDESLEAQLKGLYLKQELSRFAGENQGLPPAELRKNFAAFLERVAPDDLSGPTWTPGQYRL